MLLIVFGTVVAAAVPLGVGTLAVLSGTSALFVLASLVDVTSGATELLALMGLGVGMDYSLFIVSRFREQLSLGSAPADSLEVAMATAGRTVVFSGLAVVPRCRPKALRRRHLGPRCRGSLKRARAAQSLASPLRKV